jgi:hypothetical protein
MEDGSPRPIYWHLSPFVPDGFEFTVTTDPAAIITRRLNDYPVSTTQYDMVSVASMVCGEFINKCSYPLFTCDIWWPVWPSSEPVPFFPPPPSVRTRPSFEFVKHFKPKSKWISYDKSETNVFYSALLMSQLNGNNVLYNEESVSECKLQFWGRLVDEDGLPFFGAAKFGPPKQAPCNAQKFIDINKDIVELVDLIRLSGDQVVTLEARFKLETYLRLPSYTSCAQGIDSLYFDDNITPSGALVLTVVNTTQCLNTDANTKAFKKDPCCNTIEAGTNKACRPRPQEVHIPKYLPDLKKVKDSCSTSSCVELVLDNLIEIVQELAVAEGACGKKLNIQEQTVGDYQTIQVLNVYLKCKDKNLGKFGVGFDCPNSLETPGCYNYTRPRGTFGFPCWIDKDCPGDWGCDIKKGVCKVPREVQEKNLLECLADNLPSFVISALFSKYDIEYENGNEQVSESTMVKQIKLAFVNNLMEKWYSHDCVESNDFALYRRETWFYDVFDPRIYKRYNGYAVACTTSVRLDQISRTDGDTCRDTYDFGFWYATASTKDLCLKDGEYCNWLDCKKEGLSDIECKKRCSGPIDDTLEDEEDSFCGLCFNDEECKVFSSFNSKGECERAEVCVLPDGKVVEGVTKEECEKMGQCTEPCSNRGEECTSKLQCENRGGSCSGWPYFDNLYYEGNFGGVCFSSFMTYDVSALAFTSAQIGSEINSAITGQCNQQQQYTPIGCIRYYNSIPSLFCSSLLTFLSFAGTLFEVRLDVRERNKR